MFRRKVVCNWSVHFLTTPGFQEKHSWNNISSRHQILLWIWWQVHYSKTCPANGLAKIKVLGHQHCLVPSNTRTCKTEDYHGWNNRNKHWTSDIIFSKSNSAWRKTANLPESWLYVLSAFHYIKQSVSNHRSTHLVFQTLMPCCTIIIAKTKQLTWFHCKQQTVDLFPNSANEIAVGAVLPRAHHTFQQTTQKNNEVLDMPFQNSTNLCEPRSHHCTYNIFYLFLTEK